MKILLFFLMWWWVMWKRADSVRNKQTLFFMLCFLLLPQLVRLLFFVFYPDTFFALDIESILKGFWLSFRFDFSMLALLGGICLLFINLPITNLKYRRCVILLSVFIFDIYALLLIADLVYFKYIRRHIGPDIFNFFLSVPLVLKVAWISYGWICLGIAMLFAVGIYYSQRYISREQPIRPGKTIYEALSLVMLGTFLWFSDTGLFFSNNLLTPRQSYTDNLIQGHLTMNGVFDISYHLMPGHYTHFQTSWQNSPLLHELNEEESLDITKQLLASAGEKWSNPAYPLQRIRTQFTKHKKKKNLIIFVLESLDYGSVDGIAGTHYGATPHLDALLRQGQIFDRFFACTDSTSLAGIGATMSGLCPVSGLPYFSRGLEETTQNGLGKLLAESGNYETVFVRACQDKMMYIGPMARLMGFETYGSEWMEKEKRKPSVYDADALEVLAQKFKNSTKPFAGFFFSTATHEPLGALVPSKLDARIEQQFAKNPYLRALAYTDSAIGQFLDFLKENGLYEDTAFVILGDHQFREKKKTTIWDTYHVPFAIVAPGVLEPGRIHTVAGQTDILPTLVDLFHISAPYSAMGKSLLEDTTKDWTFVSYEGNYFGFMTTNEFIPYNNKDTAMHRDMIALNRAVYTALKNNVWAK